MRTGAVLYVYLSNIVNIVDPYRASVATPVPLFQHYLGGGVRARSM